MAYPRRIHHPGLIYHVINRGNNRQAIFLEENDYRRYLSLLYHYKQKYGYKLFAFCLMTNHVHLLIKIGEVSLSKVMQSLTIAHTKDYHHKYQCCGHVWQGRFKSPIVSDDEYMLRVMKYIEENPLRAGMVGRVEEYPWSSYKMNVSQKNFKMLDRVDNHVWQGLGANVSQCIEKYTEFMKHPLREKIISEIQKGTQGAGLDNYMSEKFKKQIEELLPKKRKRGRPRKQHIELMDN